MQVNARRARLRKVRKRLGQQGTLVGGCGARGLRRGCLHLAIRPLPPLGSNDESIQLDRDEHPRRARQARVPCVDHAVREVVRRGEWDPLFWT